MRAKTGKVTRRRHKRMLKRTKGYRDKASILYRAAKNAAAQAGMNAYVSRRIRKRDFRSLWIARLNAALRLRGISYSQFIYKLTRKRVEINRKMLSELAIKEPKVFDEIVNFVQKA